MLNNNFDEIRKAKEELKNLKNKMTKSELNKFYKDAKRKKVLKEREEKGIVVKIGRPKGPQLTKSQKKQMRRERYEKERAILHAKREAEGWKPKRLSGSPVVSLAKSVNLKVAKLVGLTTQLPSRIAMSRVALLPTLVEPAEVSLLTPKPDSWRSEVR